MLYLVRGLPGSGKSTWVKWQFNCLHLEADMFFINKFNYSWEKTKVKDAHNWCYQTTKSALQGEMDVVVCNTFTRSWELQKYIALYPKATVFRIIGNYKNTHNVPDNVIKKMSERFEDIKGEIKVYV